MDYLPLASSEPPAFFFGMMAFVLLFNLAIMAGCGYAGYWVAKKYDQNPTLGAVLGFFLNWMGILVIWLIGYNDQQNKQRMQREAEWRAWHQQQAQSQQAQPGPYPQPGPQAPQQPSQQPQQPNIPYGSQPPRQ